MKIAITVILISLYSTSFSQSLSENDIKQLAQEINDGFKGTKISDGVTIRGCLAFKRTLTFSYSVNEYWFPPENMKADLIANLKKKGYSELYFNNDINVNFLYYFGNKLKKRINIKSTEFSDPNFNLGDYISIKDHPKAKGVNMKIRPPINWKEEEALTPNIVKKFVYENNVFMIGIRDNDTFYSRNEVREIYSDTENVQKFIKLNSSLKKFKLINYKVVMIDNYPTLEYKVKMEKDIFGESYPFFAKFWDIFYEDKIVTLYGAWPVEKEFDTVEDLYYLIILHVVFPEQYTF